MGKESRYIKAEKFLAKKLEETKELEKRNDVGDKKAAGLLKKRYQAELDKLRNFVETQREAKEQQDTQGYFKGGPIGGGAPTLGTGGGAAAAAGGGGFNAKGIMGMLGQAGMFAGQWAQNYQQQNPQDPQQIIPGTTYNKQDGGDIPSYRDGKEANRRGQRRADRMIASDDVYTGGDTVPYVDPYRSTMMGDPLYNVGNRQYANPYSPYNQDYFANAQGPYVGNTEGSGLSYDYDPMSNANYRPSNYLPGKQYDAGLSPQEAVDPGDNMKFLTEEGFNAVPTEAQWKTDNSLPYYDVDTDTDTPLQAKKAEGSSRDFTRSDIMRGLNAMGPIASNIYSSMQDPEWVKTAEDPYAGKKDYLKDYQLGDAFKRPQVDLRNYYGQQAKATARALDATPYQGSAQFGRLGTANILRTAAQGYGQGSQMELAEGARQQQIKDAKLQDLYGKYAREGSYIQQLKMAEDDRKMAAEAAGRNMGRKGIEQGFNYMNTELEREEQQKLLQDLYANYEMKNGRWVFKGDQTA